MKAHTTSESKKRMYNGKPGRAFIVGWYQDGKDEAWALVRHPMREMDNLWTFLHELDIFVTNNHAEPLLHFS